MKTFSNFYKLFFVIILLTTSITFISQELPFIPKAKYKFPKNFSEKFYNFMMPKRLKNSTSQRDSIYLELLDRESQMQNLKSKLNDLNSFNDSIINVMVLLTNKYEILFEERNKLKRILKDKEAELEALNTKYQEIIKASLSKNKKLNKALEEKESELAKREKRLKELENILKKKDSLLFFLNQKVRNALVNFAGDEISVKIKDGKVYVTLNDKLLFASGSAKVEKKGQEAIKTLANFFAKATTFDILIEGHTDNIPIKNAKFQDNWELSTARAMNIVRLLLSTNKQINPKRITAAGRAEFYPIADNAHMLGRARNRRTEIILIPHLQDLFTFLSNQSDIY